MELFDRLIADTASTKIIDLGYGSFDQFFAVMAEIGFLRGSAAADDRADRAVRHRSCARQRCAAMPSCAAGSAATFVPVHNESVSLMFAKQDFPPTRPECGLIRIPRLSPIVRGVIDRPSFSFAAYMAEQPGGPTEVHQWIGEIFAEFRELELRLLMGRLASSLAGPAGRTAQSVRTPQDQRALMPLEADQRAHRHAELPDFCGAAEVRQIDDEAGRQHFGAHLLQELEAASAVPPVATRSSTRITRSPLITASSCISISSMPYSSE